MKLSKIFNSLSLPFLILLVSCDANPEPKHEVPKFENTPDEINILAIGNSFTIDATQFIPDVAAQNSESQIYFARLYRHSVSLEDIYMNLIDGDNIFEFTYFQNSDWKTLTEIKCINEALLYKKWDVVVIQQVSALSGLIDTYYPFIDLIIEMIKTHNKECRICWNMTWSYAKNFENTMFSNYSYNQELMDSKIYKACNTIASTVDAIIPSGLLIKCSRELLPQFTTREFTRDGYHLDDKGRKLVALLWYQFFFNTPNSTAISNTFIQKFMDCGNLSEATLINEIVSECKKYPQ